MKVCLVGVALVLVGCTGGHVYDAQSGNPLPGVTVSTAASCTGSGCNGNNPTTTSENDGVWYFDGYGKRGPQRQINPLPGHETVNLIFTKDGYSPAFLYHHINYVERVDGDGKKYKVDEVGDVYLCPGDQPDSDGDSLCDLAETRYGTDPNNRDTDGDSIDDRSELFGGSSTQLGYGVDLHYYGANPKHKDVFVYINWYVKPIDLSPVVQAFANAPVTNPDRTTGITLHIIDGGQVAPADQVADFSNLQGGDWSPVDGIKNKYFPGMWASYAHYAIFGRQSDSNTRSGWSRGSPAHDFVVTLGTISPPYGTQLDQNGTFMHELGHNLGLAHGPFGDNCHPNDISIMNYMFQTSGLQIGSTTGVLDYSRLPLSEIDEAHIYEPQGIYWASEDPPDPNLAQYSVRIADKGCQTSGASHIIGTLGAPLDFNGDGKIEQNQYTLDITDDNKTTSVFGMKNEWKLLKFYGATTGGGAIQPPGLGPTPPQDQGAGQMPPEMLIHR